MLVLVSRKLESVQLRVQKYCACNTPGIEIRYDLYNPTMHKIEVLKLEKRLDEELFYLRDAPAEHSTVPFDMDPVPLPLSATVPVNTLKVPRC